MTVTVGDLLDALGDLDRSTRIEILVNLPKPAGTTLKPRPMRKQVCIFASDLTVRQARKWGHNVTIQGVLEAWPPGCP